MLFLRHRFGKEENRCGASTGGTAPEIVIARSESDEAIQIVSGQDFWIASLSLAMTHDCWLPARTQFQAFQTGRDAQADLALQAERLKCDRVVGATDQDVAAGADADGRAALC